MVTFFFPIINTHKNIFDIIELKTTFDKKTENLATVKNSTIVKYALYESSLEKN